MKNLFAVLLLISAWALAITLKRFDPQEKLPDFIFIVLLVFMYVIFYKMITVFIGTL